MSKHSLLLPTLTTRWLSLSVILVAFANTVHAQPVPYAIKNVIKQLDDPNPKNRSAAAIRAGQLRSALLLDALSKSLNDIDSLTRSHAASAIRSVADDRATKILVDALNHDDPVVRVQAGYRFADKSYPDRVPQLSGMLNDLQADVRLRAATAIRVAACPAGDDALITALSHLDPAVRNQAATRFISAPNPKAFDKLLAALSDTDNSVRQNAAQALRVSPEERADDAMIAALGHADPNVRMQAALRFTQKPNKKAIDALISAIDDYHSTVASYARQALSRTDDPRAKSTAKRGKAQHASNLKAWHASHAPQVPGPWRARVNEMMLLDANKRRQAAQAIIRKKDDDSTKAALAVMDHPDPTLRTYFVNWFYSKPEPTAIAKLKTALNDIDTNIRRVAARALIRSAGDNSIAVAVEMLNHHDAGVKYEACNHLTGKVDPVSLPNLVKCLSDVNDQVRQLSTRAIARIPGDEARQHAITALAHKDPVVRNEAAIRFHSMPDPVAIEPLKKLLVDQQTNVRASAVTAMKAIDGDAAATALMEILLHDDPYVRAQAMDRFYDKPDKRAEQKVIVGLSDWNVDVQRSAARALSRSGTVAAVQPLYTLTHHNDTTLRRNAVTALKAIQAAAIAEKVAEPKLPLGYDNAIHWLKESTPTLTENPRSFIEFYGGDRLVGEVLFGNPAGYYGGKNYPTNLDIKIHDASLRSLGSRSRYPSREAVTIGDVRVNTRWLRKVVWQSRDEPFQPQTVFLRDGRSLRFLSVRWHENTVKLLTRGGVRDVPFVKIAELHLSQRDEWQCYFEQLAVLGLLPNSKVIRIDDLGGSIVTSSTGRFRPFHDVTSSEPKYWSHALQPAWSLDALLVKDHSAWLRSELPPDRLPLFVSSDMPLDKGAKWRTDRNIKGGLLRCGTQTYRWGFGVHADHVLRFDLPNLARSVQTHVGLDRLAGHGGCARGIVQIKDSASPQVLFKSDLLIGSSQVKDTGNINLPPSPEGWMLELVADAAHRGRPDGTDPLNIRDTVNWLQPTVTLDAAKVTAAVADKIPQSIPAIRNWTISPENARLETDNFWRTAGPNANSFCSTLKSHTGPLTLKRRLAMSSRATQLVASILRMDTSEDPCRLEFRVDGKSIGVYSIPKVSTSSDVAPFVLPMTEHRGKTVEIEIAHLDQSPNVQLHWRAIHVALEPPKTQ